jgi:uroporphyrinogen-III synthase
MRVIVTRPAAQADSWVDALEELGVKAVALPLMHICAVPNSAPVIEAWQQLAASRLVFFVSANAVAHFFEQRPADVCWPAGVWAGSTGPGTTAALQACGLAASQILEPAGDSAQFDSESLWQQQLCQLDWQGASVQIVRGDGGREWLADTLRDRGASVSFVAAYRRSEPEWDESAKALVAKALAQPAAHLWLFSSSEAIDNLMLHLGRAEPPLLLPPGCRAMATHPRIASTAQRAGFSQVWQSRPGVAEVVASLQSAAS